MTLKSKFENIIKTDFGQIREVYFNSFVEAFLFETDSGFQFIYKDNKIIIDNVSQQFKIIGSTFSNNQVSIILKKGLHRIDIQELIKKTTSSFGIWGDIEYSSIFISELRFPFLQYYSGQIKSIELSNKILLVDEQIGIICYNVLAKEVEFQFDVVQKTISTVFNHNQKNEIYWSSIDKFEISEDEKYFYVLTAYEGKSLFVFRANDFSLLYHEIGTYALSLALFENDNLIILSGYDFDANDKQPFKIVNLESGVVCMLNNSTDNAQNFLIGAKYKNLCITISQLSNSEIYHCKSYLISLGIGDIRDSKIIYEKEILIDPEIIIEKTSIKNIFVQDNYLIVLYWNNTISLHSLIEKAENIMDELIISIFSELKDYRADEGNLIVQMTPECIRLWIKQFKEELRIPILTELLNIFKQRYCSRKNIKEFLETIVSKLSKYFDFTTPQDFLRNSNFLNLQPQGKSQRVLLSLFDELIQNKFGLSLAECGTTSKKYSIYIDDILCTGLTLISNIKEWSEKAFSQGKTNKQAVADGSTILVFAYIFIHEKNYYKKKAEMRYKISKEVSNNHKMYRMCEVENGTSQSSKIDLVFPLEVGQSQNVVSYKNEIIKLVDNHTKRYNTISPEEFYRPAGLPHNEQFFTSVENRIIVENAFLQKGIEILQNARPNNKNIRALGYSIPALKNFGFGALCFTWRNVPNNAPLVFWYLGGGFSPLFKVTRGSNPAVNFAANQTGPNDDLPF